ncbi:hypothetical protein [Kitasatospora sp. HPMI-4]|uniref:hypothetical protein n=1 Tax=Kitasatospora sp. HPMI-4 TaxID=3448443 RepID=UPI003F1D9E80
MERFVRAVSPRWTVRAADAAEIGWANSYGTGIRLDAVDPVRPVAMNLAVYTRQLGWVFRIVAFDLDASRGGLDQVAADEARLRALLLSAGIPVVVATSGPSGGRHLWTACPAGLGPHLVARIARAAEQLCPSLDIAPLLNPRTGCLRPPGAAHRAGGHSVLDGDDVETALRVLQRGATPAAYGRLVEALETLARAAGLLPAPLAEGSEGGVPASIAARGPVQRDIVIDRHGLRLDVKRRPLGQAAVQALAYRPAADEDHSRLVHCRARSLALAGGTIAELRILARDRAATPALEWLRTARAAGGRVPLDEREAERRIRRVWYLAVQDAARMPRGAEQGNLTYSEVQALVADLFARAAVAGEERWARPSGPSDLAAITALGYQMLLAGSIDISPDCRRTGVLMNRSHQTANLALKRVRDDGWVRFTEEADLQQGTARRLTLATEHVCTGEAGHVCAVYEAPADAPAVMDLRAAITARIVAQQGDIWHTIGHHARHTLLAVEDLVVATTDQLIATSPYRPATARRHLAALAELQLIAQDKAGRWHRTEVTLAQAARGARVLGRVADLAVRARIDQAVAAWWAAHVEWSRLDRAAKRRHGQRPSPDQGVLPGADPTARAYPQVAEPQPDGNVLLRADHQRAWAIEAERLGAAGLWHRAVQLQDQDQVVDTPYLHLVELTG